MDGGRAATLVGAAQAWEYLLVWSPQGVVVRASLACDTQESNVVLAGDRFAHVCFQGDSYVVTGTLGPLKAHVALRSAGSGLVALAGHGTLIAGSTGSTVWRFDAARRAKLKTYPSAAIVRDVDGDSILVERSTADARGAFAHGSPAGVVDAPAPRRRTAARRPDRHDREAAARRQRPPRPNAPFTPGRSRRDARRLRRRPCRVRRRDAAASAACEGRPRRRAATARAVRLRDGEALAAAGSSIRTTRGRRKRDAPGTCRPQPCARCYEVRLRPWTRGLAGKNVVVTGASGGIGSACARAFAAEGARVIVHYNTGRENAEALAAELDGARRDPGGPHGRSGRGAPLRIARGPLSAASTSAPPSRVSGRARTSRCGSSRSSGGRRRFARTSRRRS